MLILLVLEILMGWGVGKSKLQLSSEHLSSTFWHAAVGFLAVCETGRYPLQRDIVKIHSVQQNFFLISFTFLFVCSQSVHQELQSQVSLCLRLDQTVDICLWRGRRWCSEATGNCQWKKSTFFPKLTLQFECLRVSEQEGGWFSQSLERVSIKSCSKVWLMDWRETVSIVLL